MSNKLKSIFARPTVRYFIISLFSLMIGFGIYTASAKTLLGNQLPMPFGVGISVVVSGSMEPAISPGDLVIIRKQDSYREGDIVAFQYQNMSVIHRIEEIDNDYVITRGDANNTSDDPIPINTIKGCIVCRIPKLGDVLWAMKSPVGILTMLILAFLLIEYGYHQEKEETIKEQAELEKEIQILREEIQRASKDAGRKE